MLPDVVKSPINIFLAGFVTLFIYRLVRNKSRRSVEGKSKPSLPKLRKDFTLQELRLYDGNGSDGRILIAVNGKVFDCTTGEKLYGQGGPYAVLAGTDASRSLATFSVEAGRDEYDDLSDLNSVEMESVHEWDMQFTERYDYVGRLLKPGEQPTTYPQA